jgi:hypothetical protein
VPDEPMVPEEETHGRPRRRPVLLAMLAAAAILVAVLGSGTFAGGSSGSGDESTPVQAKPAADEQLRQGEPGAGMTHRGRQCHHDGQNRTAPSESPPV